MVTPTDWGYVLYNELSEDVERFEANMTEERARQYVDVFGKSKDFDLWRGENKNWKIALIHFVKVCG
jgi:hypothetical protein